MPQVMEIFYSIHGNLRTIPKEGLLWTAGRNIVKHTAIFVQQLKKSCMLSGNVITFFLFFFLTPPPSLLKARPLKKNFIFVAYKTKHSKFTCFFLQIHIKSLNHYYGQFVLVFCTVCQTFRFSK